MPRIAISYRRDDSQAITGRIFDRLVARYGRDPIFWDVDSIPFGVDFRNHIAMILDECDVIIVVVGNRWLGGRRKRLEEPDDYVRIEVETALRKGVPVVPLLVGGATMPAVASLPDSIKNFAYRNGLQVDAGRDFDTHITRLISELDRVSVRDHVSANVGGLAEGVGVARDEAERQPAEVETIQQQQGGHQNQRRKNDEEEPHPANREVKLLAQNSWLKFIFVKSFLLLSVIVSAITVSLIAQEPTIIQNLAARTVWKWRYLRQARVGTYSVMVEPPNADLANTRDTLNDLCIHFPGVEFKISGATWDKAWNGRSMSSVPCDVDDAGPGCDLQPRTLYAVVVGLGITASNLAAVAKQIVDVDPILVAQDHKEAYSELCNR